MFFREQERRLQLDCERPTEVPPDIAENIEDWVDATHTKALSIEIVPAVREGEIVATTHVSFMDKIAATIRVAVRDDKLGQELLGFYCQEIRTILLHTPMKPRVRMPVFGHETFHAARPWANHDEVRYGMLALLVPRLYILRADRLTETAIAQVLPWSNIPCWILTNRVRLFQGR